MTKLNKFTLDAAISHEGGLEVLEFDGFYAKLVKKPPIFEVFFDHRLQVIVLFDLGLVDDDARRRWRGEQRGLGFLLGL